MQSAPRSGITCKARAPILEQPSRRTVSIGEARLRIRGEEMVYAEQQKAVQPSGGDLNSLF